MTYRPPAIIVDIDGTMAHRTERGPYDWDRVGEDLPNYHVIAVVQAMHAQGYEIIFVSGRLDTCKTKTFRWLRQFYDASMQLGSSTTWQLHMRPVERQYDKDFTLKHDIYREHIEPYYEVVFVLDDRDSVVKMWRDIGLPCFQVAPGGF